MVSLVGVDDQYFREMETYNRFKSLFCLVKRTSTPASSSEQGSTVDGRRGSFN